MKRIVKTEQIPEILLHSLLIMSGNFTDLLIQLNTVATDEFVSPWAKVLIECFQRFMSLYDNFHPQNLNNTINELNDEIANLRADVKQLKELIDDYEQRNRNECLVVHGIPKLEALKILTSWCVTT